MSFLNSNLSKVSLLLLSLFFLIVIGVLDYFTGTEISLLLFYLFPIFFLALHKNTTRELIIVNALFGGTIWFLAEYCTRNYTNDIIAFWNALVRLSIFFLFGLLLRLLNERFLRLEIANKKLHELNTEKNKFIGMAAHDIRNPIGTISSFSDLLISDFSDKMDEEALEMVGYIKELSTNSLLILKNVLDVSKIESGIIDIITKNQDYISFLKKQIFYYQIIANGKNINLKFESQFDTVFFDFDENYLGEVVSNLLTNAIKFSNKNSEITVKISIVDEKKVRTEIVDFGNGIPEVEHYKLFNYFQKTSTQPTAGEQSTGLGLAISKKIIDEHKGVIGFTSEHNKGSIFYFELKK